MASSSSGGSGSGGTSGGSRPPGGGGYSSGQPPRGSGGAGGGSGSGQSPFSSSGRPTRPTAPAGQERTVSYQREEERYWTDYLRVALPVIGLLLMLGLFWYWAQSLIGDDDDNAPPTGIAELISQPSPTPTVPQQAAIDTTPGGGDAQTDTGDEAEPTETPTDETNGEQADGQDGAQETDADAEDDPDQTDGADQADAGDGFQADDIVVVTEDGAPLNMRSDTAISDENLVTTLDVGTELRIISGPVEAEGYLWYEVANDETGEEGWVVDDVEGSPTIVAS